MKKLLLLTFSLTMIFSATMVAQDLTFADDFEAYSDGDKIGASSNVWRTWGNTSAADADVTTDEAHSGINSLLLFSQAQNGGPADVILPFGDKYTEGIFKMTMWMYIEDGTGTYYNFQGEVTEGQQWVMQTYFKSNGEMEVQNSGNVAQATVPYTYNEWIKISWDINLSDNVWSVSMNDQEVVAFSNPVNTIASMDLYPSVQDAPYNSLAYIDDISFEYTKPKNYALDASVIQINAKQITIAKSVVPLSVTIRNQGSDDITSFDISWEVNGNSKKESVSGMTLKKGQSTTIYASEAVTTTTGDNNIKVSVSNVNNGTDENDTNDSKSHVINAVTPAPHKGVLVEEATGTWCGWCPRGAVYMDSMERDYPLYFVGVAVHGGSSSEPMLVNGYSDRISAMISGYPRIVTERNTNNDPLAIEGDMIKEVQVETVAKLDAVGSFNLATRQLDVIVSAEFLSDVNEQYKLGAILVENHVTGTTSAYNQANYYSGGSRGPMGGYENLPRTVPAKDMVYDIVGRSVFGKFDGVGSFGAAKSVGDAVSETFSMSNVPADWDENEFDLVAILIAPDGTVDNAIKVRDGLELVTANENVAFHNHVHIAPNPTNGMSYIHLNIDQSAEVIVQIHSVNGSTVANKNYGSLDGKVILPIDSYGFASGIYNVTIQVGNERIAKKIIVE